MICTQRLFPKSPTSRKRDPDAASVHTALLAPTLTMARGGRTSELASWDGRASHSRSSEPETVWLGIRGELLHTARDDHPSSGGSVRLIESRRHGGDISPIVCGDSRSSSHYAATCNATEHGYTITAPETTQPHWRRAMWIVREFETRALGNDVATLCTKAASRRASPPSSARTSQGRRDSRRWTFPSKSGPRAVG